MPVAYFFVLWSDDHTETSSALIGVYRSCWFRA